MTPLVRLVGISTASLTIAAEWPWTPMMMNISTGLGVAIREADL